jgi:transcriptional regulator of NAD metabolism
MIMTGEARREKILSMLREAGGPISGTVLARNCQVSRQVIVQDIALLRAVHHEVTSTSRGYLLVEEEGSKSEAASELSCYRVYHVFHTDEQIGDELNTIVDNGGKVLDVFVEHEVYGSIRADLKIQCRRHVQDFLEEIRSGQSSPLKNLTFGTHYHTVEADSQETLDIIELELKKKGYLL